MIHTPLSTEIPLVITDSNYTTVFQVNLSSITQPVDGSIIQIMFTLVDGMNDHTGYRKYAMCYFKSRLQLRVQNKFFTNSSYPGNNKFKAYKANFAFKILVIYDIGG